VVIDRNTPTTSCQLDSSISQRMPPESCSWWRTFQQYTRYIRAEEKEYFVYLIIPIINKWSLVSYIQFQVRLRAGAYYTYYIAMKILVGRESSCTFFGPTFSTVPSLGKWNKTEKYFVMAISIVKICPAYHLYNFSSWHLKPDN